jgi:hypothetical protein
MEFSLFGFVCKMHVTFYHIVVATNSDLRTDRIVEPAESPVARERTFNFT